MIIPETTFCFDLSVDAFYPLRPVLKLALWPEGADPTDTVMQLEWKI